VLGGLNVFIERLWRSLKYECIYLHAFETGLELRAGLTWWISYYNTRRSHSMLAGRTRDEAYRPTRAEKVGGLTTTRTGLSKPPNCSTDQDHLRGLPWQSEVQSNAGR
jgi:putative transposase